MTSRPLAPTARAEGASFRGDLSAAGDLQSEVAARLRVAAVLFAAGFMLAWLAAPRVWWPQGGFPIFDATALTAVALSALMFALSLVLAQRPDLLVDAGLLFEVAACLLVAFTEQWLPWPPDHLARGVSWTCLVIALYPLCVPSTPGKAVLAALASASMGPLALLISTLKGNPVPAAATWAGLFLPGYLSAGLAWVLARTIHHLGERVQQGHRLGSYQLEELLGRGGMGEVWRARHRLLARPAAIKLVRPESVGEGAGSATLRRFEREAQATAGLRSPNTISLYDFGVARDGTFYYVMELLDGLDMASLVERFGPLPPERAVHLLAQVCSSLAEAHHHGLIHRDIKPANVYVCRLGLMVDVVKVLDFGLVTEARKGSERLTATGAAGGTPAYMAPEMALDGHRVDARTDVYALGCVAYWLLTGKLVFEADSPVQAMMSHIQATPVPPSRRSARALPPELERLVLECLEKDPNQRPQSAADVAARLAAIPLDQPWTTAHAAAWWEAHLP